MKILELYVYPIKGLRGVRLQTAQLTPQGILHDRRFMICRLQTPKPGPGRTTSSPVLTRLQVDSHPPCALFETAFSFEDGDRPVIEVRYHVPNTPVAPAHPSQAHTLRIPLAPETSGLERVEIEMHGSATEAVRMGDPYDAWFTACMGFPTFLLFIGNGRRDILGLSPASRMPAPSGGLLAWLSSYVWGPPSTANYKETIAFNDMASFLVTSEASLTAVNALLQGDASTSMYKFRPNIVVDGEDAWDEDFWAELAVEGTPILVLTGNCGRCVSLNVDYDTGRFAEGELGAVHRRLMKTRRVDTGNRWSPVFGRYAFLVGSGDDRLEEVSVGNEVTVVRRNRERDVWDWPTKSQLAAMAQADREKR